MTHLTIRISLFLSLILISSCSSFYVIGEDFDETKVNSLAIGETTKSEVLQILGEPYDKGQINESTVFIYSYEENEFPLAGGRRVHINKNHKSLMILFDEKNLVKSFTHNIPLSFSNLEVMILHDMMRKRKQNNENYNNY